MPKPKSLVRPKNSSVALRPVVATAGLVKYGFGPYPAPPGAVAGVNGNWNVRSYNWNQLFVNPSTTSSPVGVGVSNRRSYWLMCNACHVVPAPCQPPAKLAY